MRSLSKLWLAALLSTATNVVAQQVVEVKDPANLTGEHVAPQSPADTLPINHGAPALQQLLLKLRTRASMMFIVAHPDDEDGGLLTFESRGQGVRVAMLTLTRGEGGQNLMSADFNDALGLIRTQELLAADRYLGVDQMFGTEIDFGFSKTKEETFAQWTHERVLYDAVRAVRLYRPLVLASVFVGGPTDGHGHHQVAGEICQEVFKAAADPNVFPEMIREGLLPWAPLKVYARVPFSRVASDGMFDYATGKTVPTRFENYVTGAVTNHVPDATVIIHEGDPAVIMGKPALGMDGLTYVQFARMGLGLQRTQIGQGVRMPSPGRSDAGYTIMGSRLANPPTEESTLFDGIDISLPAIAGLAPSAPIGVKEALTDVDASIIKAQQLFDPSHMELCAPPLHDAIRALDALIELTIAGTIDATEKANLLHELRIKHVQLNNALVLALQVQRSAMMVPSPDSPAFLVPGSNYSVKVGVTYKGTEPVTVKSANMFLHSGNQSSLSGGPFLQLDSELPSNEPQSFTWTETVPPAPPTQPYFHPDPKSDAVYIVDDPSLRNAPQTPDPLQFSLGLKYRDVTLQTFETVREPELRREPDVQDAAVVPKAAIILPSLSVDVFPRTIIVPVQDAAHDQLSFSVEIHTNLPDEQTRLQVKAPVAWKQIIREPEFTLAHIGDHHKTSIDIVPTGIRAGQGLGGTPDVRVSAVDGHERNHTISMGYRSVGYPGLTPTIVFRDAAVRVVGVDVTTAPNLKIAYLPGTGDDVPDFLPNLGVKPSLITPKDLTPENLKQYDAIILGVRAYAAQSALAGKGSQPLLDYARNGGVVIVQYMTARYGNAEAPYPISVPGDSAHNVVVEAQPVSILAPDAPLLTWPNKLTSADFQNWVEEWGHGFAASWAPEYQPLLEVHDPDQDPQKGGLLLAPVGKGAYIYCALALYRQLPEGVPGAYRLFANLLSYAKNPHRN